MPSYLLTWILLCLALALWLASALLIAVQCVLFLQHGVWPSLAFGDALRSLNLSAPSLSWLGGEGSDDYVRGLPLAFIIFVVGSVVMFVSMVEAQRVSTKANGGPAYKR